MVMGGPRFQEIMVQPWPVFQWRKRPSFRTLTSAKQAVFPIPFASRFQGGKKWARWRNTYPRLAFGKGYLEMATDDPLSQKILANQRANCGAPDDPLVGP